jgi:hypothetical protein
MWSVVFANSAESVCAERAGWQSVNGIRTAAAQQQNWDPSIQALLIFPDVMKRLNDDIDWTTNLGNAFLAQQTAVMNAIQRMRLSAQGAGKLVSTLQQQVLTTTEAGETVVTVDSHRRTPSRAAELDSRCQREAARFLITLLKFQT